MAKEKLSNDFLTAFISEGWEKVGALKSSIDAIKKDFSGANETAEILQDLVDAYLIFIGRLETQLKGIEIPRDEELTEALYELAEGRIDSNNEDYELLNDTLKQSKYYSKFSKELDESVINEADVKDIYTKANKVGKIVSPYIDQLMNYMPDGKLKKDLELAKGVISGAGELIKTGGYLKAVFDKVAPKADVGTIGKELKNGEKELLLNGSTVGGICNILDSMIKNAERYKMPKLAGVLKDAKKPLETVNNPEARDLDLWDNDAIANHIKKVRDDETTEKEAKHTAGQQQLIMASYNLSRDDMRLLDEAFSKCVSKFNILNESLLNDPNTENMTCSTNCAKGYTTSEDDEILFNKEPANNKMLLNKISNVLKPSDKYEDDEINFTKNLLNSEQFDYYVDFDDTEPDEEADDAIRAWRNN